jgi:hypothetical protein
MSINIDGYIFKLTQRNLIKTVKTAIKRQRRVLHIGYKTRDTFLPMSFFTISSRGTIILFMHLFRSIIVINKSNSNKPEFSCVGPFADRMRCQKHRKRGACNLEQSGSDCRQPRCAIRLRYCCSLESNLL